MGEAISNVWLRLTPDGDMTVFELEHSPIPVEIIPNASPEVWGLGSGWEMGLTALDHYLNGELPESKATDWIADATPEQLMEAGRLSARISEAWAAVIAMKE
jgi:hypothetical protein